MSSASRKMKSLVTEAFLLALLAASASVAEADTLPYFAEGGRELRHIGRGGSAKSGKGRTAAPTAMPACIPLDATSSPTTAKNAKSSGKGMMGRGRGKSQRSRELVHFRDLRKKALGKTAKSSSDNDSGNRTGRNGRMGSGKGRMNSKSGKSTSSPVSVIVSIEGSYPPLHSNTVGHADFLLQRSPFHGT